MFSVQGLREFVSERLTSAAEEIFRVFEQTVVEYEKEIVRQRRLLDMVLKPELKLHRTSEYKHNGLQETNTKEVVFFLLSVCQFAGFSKNYWWWCCSHTQHIRSDRYTDSSSHVRENCSLQLYQTFTYVEILKIITLSSFYVTNFFF